MLQTKIFQSKGSDVYGVEDQFNAWVSENPNLNITDVKYQHAMTSKNDIGDCVLTTSIMVLFDVVNGSEPYSRFKWNTVWNRRSYYNSSQIGNIEFVQDAIKENPKFPLVGELPEYIAPVLVKLSNGSYCISQRGYSADCGHYFEGIDDEHFSWQYLPE